MTALTKLDEPTTKDGRNVDPQVGLLEGEGSGIRLKHPESAYPAPTDVLRSIPSHAGTSDPNAPSYYGLPVLKEPVWVWPIPVYFYVGGLAGATSTLVGAAEILAPRKLHGLIRRGRWVGAAGDALSAVLLINDLGRPLRFLNMLRVFRPTSPMNLGTWILSGSGAFNGLAALLSLVSGQRSGPLAKIRRASSIAASALGMPLAGYTAVLITNTAVPVWQAGRKAMPLLFMSSAVTSAAAFLEFVPLSRREQRVVRRFGLIGRVAEAVATLAFEREVARPEVVAAPLRQGVSGALWKAAKACNLAGLALAAWPGRAPRWARLAAAAASTLGAFGLRLAIFQAGKASARDPRATFQMQRAGRGAAEIVRDGRSAVPRRHLPIVQTSPEP